MGWFNSDYPGHEGYLVALERDPAAHAPYFLREIRYPDDREREDVRYFKIACDCGWRSRLYAVPWRAKGVYWPHIFYMTPCIAGRYGDEFIDRIESEASDIWSEHARAETHRARSFHLIPTEEPSR